MPDPLLDAWQFDSTAPVAVFGWPDHQLELLCRFPAQNGGPSRLRCEDPERDIVLLSSATPGGVRADLGGTHTSLGPSGRTRLTYVPAGVPLTLDYPDFAPPLIAMAFPRGAVTRLAGSTAPPSAFALRAGEREAHVVFSLTCLIIRDWPQDGAVVAKLGQRLAEHIGALDATEPLAERMAIAPRRMQSVLAFVETNLGKPITLGNLAQVASLSSFHFARAFKQETGQSPYGYVQRRRIMRAIGLLGETDRPVYEIAGLTGFTSAPVFSHRFGLWTGQSPSRFRQTLVAALHPPRAMTEAEGEASLEAG